MKNNCLTSFRLLSILCFLIFGTTILFAQSLKPTQEDALYKHLIEINKEWQYFATNLNNKKAIYTFNNDEERIQLHLQLVHRMLLEKNTDKLSRIQGTNRKRHLDVLEGYWKRAIFPVNNLHNHRQPYFVDYKQNACAVGYLMQQDGQEELVQQINKEHNFAYVEELVKRYPVIKEWAFDNGFTLGELALIQPGYGPPAHTWFSVGNGGGVVGKINVMKTNSNGSLLYMAGQFSNVDGVDANSVIAWDGQSWHTLGSGIDGEILDMDTDWQGNLFVVGNFLLNDDPAYSNIAVWDGTNWTGLQQGNMGGSVRTVLADNHLYVGGDFEMIDGEPISYIARKEDIDSAPWANHSTVVNAQGNLETIPEAFSVNAPVNDIIRIESRLLFAGDFTQTAPDVNGTPINQLDTDYLAYWFNGNWDLSFSGSYQAVEAVSYLDERIFIGGAEPGDNAYSTFTAGFWNPRHLAQLDGSPGADMATVRGFVEHNGAIYAYGNIANVPIVGIYSTGFVQIGSVGGNLGNTGGTNFDKTVRACEVFQDNVYFAGDFTWAGAEDNSFNGLVYSPLGINSGTKSNNKFPIEIYTTKKQLHIQYENLKEPTQLQIYNLQGQIVHSLTLESGAATLQEDLSKFIDGIFVYELNDGQTRSSAKLSVF